MKPYYLASQRCVDAFRYDGMVHELESIRRNGGSILREIIDGYGGEPIFITDALPLRASWLQTRPWARGMSVGIQCSLSGDGGEDDPLIHLIRVTVQEQLDEREARTVNLRLHALEPCVTQSAAQPDLGLPAPCSEIGT